MWADDRRLGFDQHFLAVDSLRALVGVALQRRDLDTAEWLTKQAIETRAAGSAAVTPKTPDWTGDHRRKSADVSGPRGQPGRRAGNGWPVGSQWPWSASTPSARCSSSPPTRSWRSSRPTSFALWGCVHPHPGLTTLRRVRYQGPFTADDPTMNGLKSTPTRRWLARLSFVLAGPGDRDPAGSYRAEEPGHGRGPGRRGLLPFPAGHLALAVTRGLRPGADRGDRRPRVRGPAADSGPVGCGLGCSRA